jgi:hypothetical protein
MPDDFAAQEAEVRKLVAAFHEHITVPSDDTKAAAALNVAGEAALKVLVARIESDEPPSALSESDRVAWGLVRHSLDEVSHGNQRVGDWYRLGARACALARYTDFQV